MTTQDLEGARASFLTINRQLALLITGVSGIVCLVLALLSYSVARSFAHEEFLQFSRDSLEELALRLPDALEDPVALDQAVTGFFRLSHGRVSSLVIADPSGAIRDTFGAAPSWDVATDVANLGQADTGYRLIEMGEGQSRAMMPLFDPVTGNFLGSVSTLQSDKDLLAALSQSFLKIEVFAAVLFFVMAGGGIWALRFIVDRPLQILSRSVTQLAEADYSHSILGQGRQDVLGELARRISDLQSRLIAARDAEDRRHQEQEELVQVVSVLRHGLEALARANLSEGITAPFAEVYEPLRADFNVSVEKLRHSITSIVAVAEIIEQGVSELMSSSSDLALRTETQAATLEQTATALADINMSVGKAAQNAAQVDEMVAEATAQSEQSNAVVNNAIAAMTAIEESSTQISTIIKVIDDIAFQTNLLALNAGVEAARAGESGRGFAIVATEVRSLANRSSEAALAISDLIRTSNDQVSQGVELVREAGTALGAMSGRVAQISTLMSGIATAAEEQATGLSEINIAVTQLDQVTQQNAAMVEEANAACDILRSNASDLMDVVRVFDLGLAEPGTGLSDLGSSGTATKRAVA